MSTFSLPTERRSSGSSRGSSWRGSHGDQRSGPAPHPAGDRAAEPEIRDAWATSEAEVTNISGHGFWLLLDGRELFLPFDHFPWFKRAPVESILRVERPAPEHLHWPALDVDLSVGSIEHPERYPLAARS